MTINIDTLLPWSAKRLVETRYGMKNIQSASPTPEFWDAWREHKDTLKAAGVGVSKDLKTKDWVVNLWTDPPPELAQKLEANIKQSTSVDAIADIEIPCPDGLAYRPYQRGAIAFAVDKAGTLLCDEMGLGKTVEAIGLINIDPTIKKVLIVCPVSLKLNWYNELKRWLTRPLSIGIATPTGFPSYADVVIVGYSVVHRFTDLFIDYDLAILDEATAIKNRKTIRNEACKKIKARRRLALSGTPMENNPQEMFELLNWADPVGHGNFFRFVTKYCGARKVGRGFDYQPTDQDLANCARHLRETVMVRRLKADVASEIPPKTRSIVEMECRDPVLKQEMEGWKRFEPRLQAIAVAMELAKASGNDDQFADLVEQMKKGHSAAFEEMAAVRVKVAQIKLPYVLDMIESQFVANGIKVVTFGHHRFMIEAIAERFGDQCVTHYGGMNENAKWASVNGFQTDPKILVFNGSLIASGMGITLTAATNALCYEYDWRPGIMAQAEDRIHRIGQVNPVSIHLLVLQDSLDAYQVKTYVGKAIVIGKALDGPIADAPVYQERPAFVPVGQRPPLSPKKEAIRKLAASLPADHAPIIHAGLQILAAMDTDHARDLNDMGFSKIDVSVGHALAGMKSLSPGQAAFGFMLCRKYRRQLPKDMVDRLGLTGKESHGHEEG